MGLVGNKTDEYRVVSETRGANYARLSKMFYIETSVKDMECVTEPFEKIARLCLQKMKESNLMTDMPDNALIMTDQNSGRSKSRCCYC